MNSGKTRSSLIGIVGGYLIYLAYQIFQGRNDPDTTMSPGMMVLFIALFVAAGAGLVVYACVLWKRSLKEDSEGSSQDKGSWK